MSLRTKVLLAVFLPALALIAALVAFADRYNQEQLLTAGERDLGLAADQAAQLIDGHVARLDAKLIGLLSQGSVAAYIGMLDQDLLEEAEGYRPLIEESLRGMVAQDRTLRRIEIYDHLLQRFAAIVDSKRDLAPVDGTAEAWLADLRPDQTIAQFHEGGLRLAHQLLVEPRAGLTATAVILVDLDGPARDAARVATQHLPMCSVALDGPDGHLYGPLPEPDALRRSVDLPRLGARITISMAPGDAVAGYRERRSTVIAALSLAGVALVLLTWFGLRRAVLRPVKSMQAVVGAFERGETPPAPPDERGDELAELSAALHHALAGYRAINENLEQRVRERSAALAESEERFQLAIRGANDAIWDWDLETDRVFYSPRFAEIVGADGPVPQTPASWLSRVHPDDRGSLDALLEAHLGEGAPFWHEHRLETTSGWRWVLARGQAVRPADGGRPLRMAGSLADVTARKRAEEALRHQALHDPLTGLFNRQHLLDSLDRAIAAAVRYGHPLTLCMCDIDHFKAVNDGRGHRVGDEVLLVFSQLIGQNLRDADFAGRYGGDEFCLVFPHTSGADAAISIDRLRVALGSHAFDGGLRVSGSFGAAELPGPMSAEDLMERADRALYQAKEAGRDRVVVECAGD